VSDFVFWAEPQPVWVHDGLQLLVGAGEVEGGEPKAFLAIHTAHSNSHTTMSLRALDDLIEALKGIREAVVS
jgi:hypothetical protein